MTYHDLMHTLTLHMLLEMQYNEQIDNAEELHFLMIYQNALVGHQ